MPTGRTGADYTGKRGLKPAGANEALADPDRIVLNPDPASKSGRSVRVIGYSITAQAVLTAVVLDDEGITYGVNAWPANRKDQRRYEGTEES
ncbi:hypothetical protein [Mycobacterium canetti]|uniref:hypothetical protein n=1 Tax=Mycobacterium canetti TaxID=78331 RepID=UPI0002A599CD|nr:hypothetical protein [Mycobacterium canetti]CCK60768.1 Conserved protein of unknown function, possible IS sequence associated protein [Mycobacterium canettii CIPT 140070010]